MTLDLLYEKISEHSLFINQDENIERFVKSLDYPDSFGLKFSNPKISGEIFYYSKKTPFLDVMIVDNESLKTFFKIIEFKEDKDLFSSLIDFLDDFK